MSVSGVYTKVAGLKPNGGGAGSGTKPTCHFCGEEGHMSYNCKANPDSSKYDPKFKPKKAAKKTDEAADDDE